MRLRNPKRYVKVNDGELKIYDCQNQPYMIIDGRLYMYKNLDKTETFARRVYADLGEVLEESDVIDYEKGE